jgi:MFS transporter, ACS family, D-galactonate transporter
MICGIIMLVGGIVGMALMRPEHETVRWASEISEAAVRPA